MLVFRAAQGHAVHDDLSVLDGFKLVDAPDERALSGAAGAADHHDFSLLDHEVNIVQDMKRPKPLVDFTKFDHQTLTLPSVP